MPSLRIGRQASRRRRHDRLATALASIAVLAATGTTITPAFAAPTRSDEVGVTPGSVRHCVIVLDKIRPGETTSRVRAHECAVGKLPRIAASSTLLMTWYQYTSFGGESTRIEGYDGPCDSSGYGISDVGAGWWGGSWWDNRISSFKVYNHCNWTTYFTNVNYGGDGSASRGSERDVGDLVDNRISSMTTRRWD